MDYHLITAQEARELAISPYRKHYSNIEKIAKQGYFSYDFDVNTKTEKDSLDFNDLIEDFRKRGYKVDVFSEKENEWKYDEWGEAIERSCYVKNHVKVEW